MAHKSRAKRVQFRAFVHFCAKPRRISGAYLGAFFVVLADAIRAYALNANQSTKREQMANKWADIPNCSRTKGVEREKEKEYEVPKK